ncbi:MAG: hypothetical protein F6K48_24355, partial [Okeania sp. SIO3H1]|nr:hypothetical protein [Okeania sp. SIO3H1]
MDAKNLQSSQNSLDRDAEVNEELNNQFEEMQRLKPGTREYDQAGKKFFQNLRSPDGLKYPKRNFDQQSNGQYKEVLKEVRQETDAAIVLRSKRGKFQGNIKHYAGKIQSRTYYQLSQDQLGIHARQSDKKKVIYKVISGDEPFKPLSESDENCSTSKLENYIQGQAETYDLHKILREFVLEYPEQICSNLSIKSRPDITFKAIAILRL